MKIRLVGAESFHVDGHDKANSHFSQFLPMHLKTTSDEYVPPTINNPDINAM